MQNTTTTDQPQTTTTPAPGTLECQHLNFSCEAIVNRQADPHMEPKYSLTVRTICKDCGTSFYYWTPGGSYDVVRFLLKPAHLCNIQAPPNM